MATTYTLERKQKMFMLYEYTKDANGKLVRGGMLADGAAGGGTTANVVKNTQQQAAKEAAQAAKQTAHQATSAAMNTDQGQVNKIAGQARQQGFNAGKNAATLNKQVLKNTWGSLGAGGKAGVIAGTAAVAGLAIKGLVGNKKEKTYSLKRIIK